MDPDLLEWEVGIRLLVCLAHDALRDLLGMGLVEKGQDALVRAAGLIPI